MCLFAAIFYINKLSNHSHIVFFRHQKTQRLFKCLLFGKTDEITVLAERLILVIIRRADHDFLVFKNNAEFLTLWNLPKILASHNPCTSLTIYVSTPKRTHYVNFRFLYAGTTHSGIKKKV